MKEHILVRKKGCPQAVIGCVTAQDLQKHIVEYHGTAIDADAEYPEDEPEPDADANRKQKNAFHFLMHTVPEKVHSSLQLTLTSPYAH